MKDNKTIKIILHELKSFVLPLIVVWIVIRLFISPFQVVGNSMVPNFLDGEFVIANVVGFEDAVVYKADFGKLKRGDVVVFRAPPHPSDFYIKRTIGLPGETVRLHDGHVYINNKQLDESSYLKPTVITRGEAFLQDDVTVTVPKNSYFVLGDNRPDSSDSREWGFVTAKEVAGTPIFVYWPPTEARIVTNPLSK